MAGTRGQVIFELCEAHSSRQNKGQRRLAEIVLRGRSRVPRSCTPRSCRLQPGADLFCADVTDDVAADWVAGLCQQVRRPRETYDPSDSYADEGSGSLQNYLALEGFRFDYREIPS
jgi:hypothetical protein